MKQRILYLLSVRTLILAFFLMLFLIFQLTYPFEVVKLNKAPFEIEKEVYTAGDTVSYTLDFTKKLNYKPKISYFLVNGFVYPLSKAGLSRPVGKQVRTLNLTIPKETPPGIYHIQIDLEYEINPLRKILYSWSSEDFKVRR